MPKTFNEYAAAAAKTRFYPRHIGLLYTALKLNGEAGEVAEKVGKLYRDKAGVQTDEFRAAVAKELGDALYYIWAAADEVGYTLEQIAEMNEVKLADRAARNALKGDGDER